MVFTSRMGTQSDAKWERHTAREKKREKKKRGEVRMGGRGGEVVKSGRGTRRKRM